jgi:hemoglobin
MTTNIPETTTVSTTVPTLADDDKNNNNNNNNNNNSPPPPPPQQQATATTEETLFHRLGGVAVVRTAVEEFYTRLLDDAELSPFFENTKMVVLKRHQLEFFKLALTAIPANVDVVKLLSDKHDFLFQPPHGLNEYHFDLVAQHFVATMSHLGVAPEMIDEAAGVILPLRVVFEQGALKYHAADVKQQHNKETSDTADAVAEKDNHHDAPPPPVLHSQASDVGGAVGTTTKEVNLHDKLGGVAALKVVVEDFYKRLLHDAELCPFFEDINMTMLKLHQVQFMKIAFTQIPADLDVLALMHEKHAMLFTKGLNERHFDLVANHFVATLQAANVEESVIQEAAAVILPLRVVFEQGTMEHNNALA